ncbi:unnamed protein product [Paramecium octaurelia]|uniref:Uncharacterized protein n=1 Tax=Paramecium octaurelia TaxID=43137 RepID=A0A8S1UBE0_PAROT|nr:unnamed protein product [Paramecium octaurelia]
MNYSLKSQNKQNTQITNESNCQHSNQRGRYSIGDLRHFWRSPRRNIKQKLLRYSVFEYLLNRIFITGQLENIFEEQTIVQFKESFFQN